MKLPFDLGVKLVLRLIIPGFLLTLGIYPLLATVRELAGWNISAEYVLILATIVLGWIVLSFDQRIYMLAEGRRWPRWLSTPFLCLERSRLNRTIRREDEEYKAAQKETNPSASPHWQAYLEAWTELRKFPLDKEGNRVALFPTRLGNLITAYETYPDDRYGMDAMFYWYRLWLLLDKDLREELDSRQAMADSALYAAAVLLLSGVTWIACAMVPPAIRWFVGQTQPGAFGSDLVKLASALGHHLPTTGYVLAVSAGLFASARLAYTMSLFPQAQYGETFKSAFDVFQARIDVVDAIHTVAGITGYEPIKYQERRTQLGIAWYYLHNYRIKCPYDACRDRDSMTPDAVRAHIAQVHASPASKTGVGTAGSDAGPPAPVGDTNGT